MSETREERSAWEFDGRKVYRPGWKAAHSFECATEEQAAWATGLLQGRDEHIAALEQERDELRALVDEAATAMRWLDGHPTAGWRTTDWLSRYDSLIQEGK